MRALTLFICAGLLSLVCSAKTGQPQPKAYNQKLQQSTLLFTENKGQVADIAGQPRPDILFTAHNGAASVYLTSTGINYQFTKVKYPDGYEKDADGTQDLQQQLELEKKIQTETYRFSLTLEGANPSPVVRREDKNTFTENFYTASCPRGISGVATYGKVVYENVYPHIDWVVYSNGTRLKYDFLVHPGGDPAQIRLKIKDAQGVSITKAGELLMKTTLGEVREQAPVSFADGKKVPTRFKQNNDGTIGFNVTALQGKELRIDPTVSWATYYGGTGTDQGLSCTVDPSGNVFLYGSTASTAGIATSGGYQTVEGGVADAFLVKFDASGNRLWATYYGGSAGETPSICTADNSGNIYVTGYTSSTTAIATTGAHQTTLSGTGDVYLAKFSTSGALLWGTYYGGSGAETGGCCAVDAAGNVYLNGQTASADGIATTGAYQTALAGGTDAFLAKFTSSGSLVWGTYYGGTANETEIYRSCTVDNLGHVYMVGFTQSTTGIATTGAYQTTYAGGVNDDYLVKFDTSGSRLWSTYFGGAGNEAVAMGCATDIAGNVYITSPSTSTTLATAGAYQTTQAGGYDAVLAKFNAAGTLKWATYYGGTAADYGYACTTDASGNVFLVGAASSTSGISTASGFQVASGGAADAYIVKFDSTGVRQWASYYGGSAAETGSGTITDGLGNIYMAGSTSSTTGIATTGALQTTIGGGQDAFLVKIADVVPLSITTGNITGSPFCAGASVSVPYTISGTFTAGNVFTAQLSNASGSFASAVTIGTVTATAAGTISATIPSSALAGTGYRIRVFSSAPVDTGSNNGTDIVINPLPVAGVITGTDSVCVGANITLADTVTGGTWSSTTTSVATVGTSSGVVHGVLAGTTTISYTVATTCGTVNATVVVTVNPLPAAGTITGIDSVCAGSTITLADVATGGTWSSTATGIATISASGVVTGSASVISPSTSTISYTTINSCGTAAATTIVTVNPQPNAGTITGTATVCAGSTITLADAATGGTWSSTTTSVATIDASGVVHGITAGTSTISYTVTNSCGTAVATIIITVNPLPVAGTITGTGVVCAGSTTTLTDAAGSGVWSSITTSVATVDASGVVAGVPSVTSSSTSTISYTVTNSCGTVAATTIVTVNPLPSAGTITGTATVCVDAYTTLSDVATGGVWSSTNPGIGTVDASGVVHGGSAGATTISYTVTNSCGTAAATTIVTVNALPDAGTITGTATVCAGSNTTLADAATGGVWSSTATVATVDASGIVHGGSAGTATISYTVANSCSTAVATIIVTVNPLPDAGTITGTATVCVDANTTLSDVATGGTWSSTSAVAMVTSGVVIGEAPGGTSTISYTVTNGCGTAAATMIVTVNPLPVAGTITGTTVVCSGSSTPLTDAASGGTWSSVTTSVAIIDASGIVTGMGSGGTSTISYTVTNSCGTAAATTVITVNPLPVPGTITGITSICMGQVITLSDAISGGTWSSTSTSIATVGTSGIVTAGSVAGTTTISYSVTNGCGTLAATVVVTVHALPAAITGTESLCAGTTTTLDDATAGGTWASSSTTVATVGVIDGVINGINGGTSTITYTSTFGCHATAEVTVNALPTVYFVTGGGTYCDGGSGLSVGISGSDPDVSYQLYNGSSPVGTALSGIGSALDFGLQTAVGTYTVSAINLSTSCTNNMSGSTAISTISSVTPSVTVSAPGGTVLCSGTSSSFTAVPVNGGTTPAYEWTVNGVTVSSGASYSYTPADGDIVMVEMTSSEMCTYPDTAVNSVVMTVNTSGTPVAGITITPNDTVCEGTTVSLAITPSFGGSSPSFRWNKNGVDVSTASSYSYVPANGDVIYAEMVSDYSCRLADSVASDNVTMTVVTATTPVVTIVASPGTTIEAGQSDTLTATVTGASAPTYQWQSNGVNISGATSATYINGFTGTDSVTCIVTNQDACGNSSSQSVIIHVNSTGISSVGNGNADVRLIPNPNKGQFTIKGSLSSAANEDISVEVVNMMGQIVYRNTFKSQNGNINESVQLDNTLANGMYLLNLHTTTGNSVFHFVKEQ